MVTFQEGIEKISNWFRQNSAILGVAQTNIIIAAEQTPLNDLGVGTPGVVLAFFPYDDEIAQNGRVRYRIGGCGAVFLAAGASANEALIKAHNIMELAEYNLLKDLLWVNRGNELPTQLSLASDLAAYGAIFTFHYKSAPEKLAEVN